MCDSCRMHENWQVCYEDCICLLQPASFSMVLTSSLLHHTRLVLTGSVKTLEWVFKKPIIWLAEVLPWQPRQRIGSCSNQRLVGGNYWTVVYVWPNHHFSLPNPTAKSKGKPCPLIAGSVGPYGAYLHDGSEYSGHYVDTMTTQVLVYSNIL